MYRQLHQLQGIRFGMLSLLQGHPKQGGTRRQLDLWLHPAAVREAWSRRRPGRQRQLERQRVDGRGIG